MISLMILLTAMTGMLILWVRIVGINLSLSSVMMGGLLTLHGPAYIYYTRSWGPGDSFMRNLYERSNTIGESINTISESINFFDYVLSFAQGRAVIAELDLALALLFVCFSVGLLLADHLLGNNPTRMRQGLDDWGRVSQYSLAPQWLPWVASALAMVAAVALAVALQEDQAGKVARYIQFNLGELEKIAMRNALGGSAHYLYNLALAAFLPLLAFWALLLMPQSPRLIVPLALFLFALVLLGKLATLSKAPPVFFLIQLIALALVCRKLQLSPKRVLALTALSLALLVVMSFVANANLHGLHNALIFLFYRIFMIPNESLVEYFSAIPSVIEHTAGRDFRWLSALLHTDSLPATYARVADVFRDTKGVSTTNAMFLADAWAGFSFAGVGAVGFFAGFALRTIDIILIVRLGKSAATVAALTAGLYGVFVALSTAFQTALLTGGLLLLVPFALIVRRLEVRTTP